MLPRTLQYSEIRPAAGTTTADVIVVSFNCRPVRLAQSAAAAGVTPIEMPLNRASKKKAGMNWSVERVDVNWTMKRNAG